MLENLSKTSIIEVNDRNPRMILSQDFIIMVRKLYSTDNSRNFKTKLVGVV